MRKIVSALIVINLLSTIFLAEPRRTPKTNALVLTHVTVIDVTGAPAMTDMTVMITGDRITGLGKTGKVSIPKGAQVVNANGKFLLPGLWDMHVHLSWTKATALPVLVANGVTGVRDLGGRLGELDEWRTKIGAGLVSPRAGRKTFFGTASLACAGGFISCVGSSSEEEESLTSGAPSSRQNFRVSSR